MTPRKYTKLIQLYIIAQTYDGYGGNTVVNYFQESLWANVITKNSSRLNENGQNDNFVQTIFTIRNRPDLNISIKYNYIIYNNLTYNIDSVLNIDLDNIDIEIQATQRT